MTLRSRETLSIGDRMAAMDDDSDPSELTARDIAVYRAVLRAQGGGFAEIAQAITGPADELDTTSW